MLAVIIQWPAATDYGTIPGMSYRLFDGDPPPESVRYLTLVPFLLGGACAAVPDRRGGLALPAGTVRPGEHWLLDTCLRVPLETAGFRAQRVHPFAADGDHIYAWFDGDRYTGHRPHATVALVTGPADELATRFTATGQLFEARLVRDALHSFRNQSDEDYYADNLRLLEPAYLRGTTPQQGSGTSSDAARWRRCREMIVDGIDRNGSFLDLGCANGLLMESVRQWAGERGYEIEPYGVDFAPGLVELARSRLPQWADRIEVGNAIDYRPDDGRRFTFVHTLLETVPVHRRGDLLRHALDGLVAPGGRLLVSRYLDRASTDLTAAEHLRALGFPVAGESGERSHSTAWIDSPKIASI